MSMFTTELPERTTWSTFEVRLAQVPSIIRRHWKMLAVVFVLGGVVGYGGAWLLPVRYRASASFVPVTTSGIPRLSSGLAGLASQFGVLSSLGGFSPWLFAALPETRAIREKVALTRYQLPPCLGADTPDGTLIQGMGLAGRSERRALEDALRRLGGMTIVRLDGLTSVVSVSVDACSPELAAAIVQSYLDAIDHFSRETLRSQATAQREFAERRIAELSLELTAAEATLVRFLEENRSLGVSAALQQEEVRLRRQVSVLEGTYLTVRTEYERA
ncbi:MAG: hypothetical protein OEN00_16355, partial [Gemmatimonadota bacterium]|nr:hypothetical protein [Gemmatimonadota bacterium]